MEKPEIKGRNQDGTFASGVSGNPAGKPKGTRHFETLFREAVKRIAEGEDEPEDILIVRKVVAKAKEGDLKAADMVFDRTDGKVAQPLANDDGEPFMVGLINYADDNNTV